MDLSTVAANLLDDEYLSTQAFLDDIQLIVDDAKKRHGLESSITATSNELLEFVNKFMMKLPGSETVENVDRVSLPQKTKKRKTTENAEEQEGSQKPKKIKRPDGMSAQMWKEQNCLAKQKEACRAGTASKAGKIRRNLVSEELKQVIDEKARKQKKEAQEKTRLENFMKLNAKHAGGKQDDCTGEVDTEVGESERLKQDSSEDPGGSDQAKKDVDGGTTFELNDTKQDKDPAEDGQPGDGTGSSEENEGTVVRIWDYEHQLQRLPTELSTQAQIDSLEHSATIGPNYLGRTASLTRAWNFGQYHRRTNGFTAQDLLLPSADVRDERYCSHNHLADLTQAEIIYMSGNHLIWKDLTGDEFLSYSRDPLFLVVGQTPSAGANVTIQFIDRRKAKTPDGALAAFYGALDLYTAFRLPLWGCWGAADEIKLHPRKFTHEAITHGPILCSESSIKQARFEDLIKDDLYDIFPEFEVPENHKYAGLYTSQVVYRKVGYPTRAANPVGKWPPIYSYEECSKTVSMTKELLHTVCKVTRNFCNVPERTDPDTVEPPLHAFISFLTFHKRLRSDQVFLDWIKEHYTEEDVRDIYLDAQSHPLPGMTNVADNLPGVMQYLDLLRDCIELFSLTPLPPNNVESHHIFNDPRVAITPTRQESEGAPRQKENGKTGGLQEDGSKESSSQELASAESITASESSATSLDEILEDGLDEEVEADESGNEQLLLARTGEDEEIAAFSRNDETAIPAGDLVFAHAKASKQKL